MGNAPKLPDFMDDWQAAWANSTKLETYHPQDVNKAKSLLQAAGWDPTTVVNVYHYPPKLTADVPVIVQMWKDVGINVKLTPIPDDTFVDIFYGSKGPKGGPDQGPIYDVAFVYGFGSVDGSPWGQDNYLGTKAVYPNGYNAMRFANAEWDTEFAAGNSAITKDQQSPHFQRCSEIFNDELPYVPMYQRVDYSAVGDKLHGPENWKILHPQVGGVRWYEWYIG
jgi:ABC-type transport system substrate-binding protein